MLLLSELKLMGREKIHYETLDNLYKISIGKKLNYHLIKLDVNQMISDWDKMMGGRSGLIEYTNKYIESTIIKDNAKILYLLLSPIFFYIHALSETSRDAWRNVVTSCGIYCERIVRNIFQEYDNKYNTNIYDEISLTKFENKNGRLKSELELRQFSLADRLFSYLKIIYNSRNQQGPHDVPPPESIQAKIIITQCLPIYVDYLNSLLFLGIQLGEGYNNFIKFFNSLTDTKTALNFGDEVQLLNVVEVLRDILYKEGFFSKERTLSDVNSELSRRRFNYSSSLISTNLSNLSKGRKAILTRNGKRGNYKYIERISPQLYFKKSI